MKRLVNIAALMLLLWVCPIFAQAQFSDPVSFSVADAPQKVHAGQKFTITLKARIKGEWHLYAANNDPEAGPFPTQFSAANKKIAIVDSVTESKPIEEYDPNFKVELGFHKHKATFGIPVAFKKNVRGPSDAALKVVYQVCNDKVCLPPKKKKIVQSIQVVAAKAGGGASENSKSALHKSTQQIKPAPLKNSSKSSFGGDGFFGFIWLALGAGFAALITPCVYPMIPLTVSFFSKQADNQKGGALAPAVGFGGAIIATFTVIGVLLAALIGVSGANKFASSPWVNVFIALVLIVFSVSLLGAFEIRLPYQLTNWLNRKSNEGTGLAGILFMALTISAVSFSCTVPFVSGVLVATTNGQWFYPIIGMVFFSAAFASPFVILAMFPSWMDALPKSGSWMNVVKVLLGFIELAAAFKFLSNADLIWNWGIVTRPLTIAAWMAIFLIAGLYILGVVSIHQQSKPKSIGTGRLLLSLPFLIFSFYLIPGLLGASLGIWDAWLPPKQTGDISVVSTISQSKRAGPQLASQKKWSNNYKASLAEARKNNQPLFIDFTGYTCTNCRAMEANVFSKASVKKSLNHLKLVRLYTDGGSHGSRNQKFQYKLTGTVALPTYVIIDPNTQRILNQTEGYTKKEVFQKFLKKGLTNFEHQDTAILYNGRK